MDEAVIHAMARWPDVPAVFGWLRLDQRGQWRLIQRDAPGFDPRQDARGETISSPAIIDFIGRNYAADQQGRWFWQNGPQRVYLALETAPLIYRVLERRDGQPGKALVAHTGYRAEEIAGAWIDPDGRVYLRTELGPGMVHDQDLVHLALPELADSAPEAWCTDAHSTLGSLHWTDLQGSVVAVPLRLAHDAAQVLGFVRNPRPPQE